MNSPASPRIAIVGAGGMLSRALQHVGGPAVTAWPSTRVDIREPAKIRAALAADRPKVVINCAAFTDVDGSEKRRDDAFTLNDSGAGNVAAACEEAAVRLVHVSTDYVFDGAKSGAYVETDEPNPLSVYGESKLKGEREVAKRCGNHVIARTAWLYGPWSRRNFVDTMLALTAKNASVNAVADVTGSPTYSIDLAEALLFLAITDLRGVVHVVNEGRTTWHGLATRIVELSGRDCDVRPVGAAAFPRPAERPANSALDCGKLRTAGHRMRRWDEALSAYLREFAGKSQ